MKIKKIRGYCWPDNATDKHVEFSLKRVKSLQWILDKWPKDKMRLVVQAGGSYGVWPNMLAEKFHTVITFEPEHKSFVCLCCNCMEKNVIKLQAALGHRREPVTIRRNSFTSHKVIGRGEIPQIQLDVLELPRCDVLLLDIEGYELQALQGAKRTIEIFKPLILVEDRPGMGEFNNIQDGEVVQWIEEKGYQLVADIQSDKIFAPVEMTEWIKKNSKIK